MMYGDEIVGRRAAAVGRAHRRRDRTRPPGRPCPPAATKPATLETGLLVQVPLFIETGEKLKIDTRTGEYQSRA